MIFQNLYLPITQRKSILFRKEELFIKLQDSSKGQTRIGKTGQTHMLFLKETFVLPTVLRTVKLIAAGVHHMRFYLLLFKWKYCMHSLKRIRNWYFDRTPQKNTMSKTQCKIKTIYQLMVLLFYIFFLSREAIQFQSSLCINLFKESLLDITPFPLFCLSLSASRAPLWGLASEM